MKDWVLCNLPLTLPFGFLALFQRNLGAFLAMLLWVWIGRMCLLCLFLVYFDISMNHHDSERKQLIGKQ